jgi:hypothetical protein
MSHHVENTVCPKCRARGADKSGNNLGVFSDGHCLCWSCGYYIHGLSNNRICNFTHNNLAQLEPENKIVLPEDVTTLLPLHCLNWLFKYEITKQEIVQNILLYSESWNQLIFPYFDVNNNLLAYQARNFNEVGHSGKKLPKWWNRGDLKEIFHILPLDCQVIPRIVLLEDIVSAIKLSRHAYAMPLFGCTIPTNRLKRLSGLTGEVVIWLDPDKRKEALQEAKKASMFNLKSSVIFSEVDPKECSDEEIRNFLRLS